MIFNPIQMGPEFTSWYMSDLEIRTRSMVNEIFATMRDRHDSISVDRLYNALEEWGLEYDELPQSCREMINELTIC